MVNSSGAKAALTARTAPGRYAFVANVGRSLIGARAGTRHNHRMERKDTAANAPRPIVPDIAELQAQIDERDEIIRLLNAALSRALSELALADRAA